MIVISTRMVDCKWLKIEEIESYEWKCLICTLWKEYLELFDFGYVHSYVTNYFIMGVV